MKNYLFVILLLLAQASLSQNFIDLAWSDEFDVNGVPNPDNWGYDLGQSGWGNNEVQNYTNLPQNVRVENGVLIIDALKSNGNWTSARLKSQGKKNFTYGRIVFRAKLPLGIGTWPALWTLGESISTVGWPACGEIDVMEHVGRDPGVILSAIHTTSSSGNTVNKNTTQVANHATAFHTYELLWTPEKLEFLADGVLYYTYQPATKNAATWPFTAPQFIIMNIAMGGTLGGPTIDPALTAARMEVDYVRVYQAFTDTKLEGPNILEKNQQGVKFKTNKLEGATYSWSLPADAVIASGDGTNEITVNWGSTEGDVTSTVVVDNQQYEKAIAVTHVAKPQGSTFSILKPDFGIDWNDIDPVNEFTFTETTQNEVQIQYNVTVPSSNKGIEGKFYRTVDMRDHSVLKVRMKSLNASGSLNARLDLADITNQVTNKTPVFNLTPLIDDGEYFTYAFDFKEQNKWMSTVGVVDASRIDKLYLYLDFGVFGTVGKDSVWIDDIWIESPSLVSTIPKRPSHLVARQTGPQLTLQWQDNSLDENGFNLYRSLTPAGEFEKIDESPPNTTSLELTTTDETRYYYRVKSFNDLGESAHSNLAETELVTALTENDLEENVEIYPNPVTQEFFVQSKHSGKVTAELVDVLGRKHLYLIDIHQAERVKVDCSQLPRGTYLLRMRTETNHFTQRLLLH